MYRRVVNNVLRFHAQLILTRLCPELSQLALRNSEVPQNSLGQIPYKVKEPAFYPTKSHLVE